MKKIILSICIISIIGVAIFLIQTKKSKQFQPKYSPPNDKNNSMKITSPNFSKEDMIPKKFTCDGEGINPELEISGAPEETKSLVLIVDDPDAPMGNFNHWVMWNIKPSVKKIGENSYPPEAVSGINSGEKNSYVSPCPPSGIHRYYFKIYALNILLNLDASSRKNDVEKAMSSHIIDQAELMGKYSRN